MSDRREVILITGGTRLRFRAEHRSLVIDRLIADDRGALLAKRILVIHVAEVRSVAAILVRLAGQLESGLRS